MYMKLRLFAIAGMVMMLASCGQKKCCDGGQRLFVGDDIAVTQTQYGLVQGYILDNVYTYLGIPYGAPTGGENRFMRTGNPNCKQLPEWPAYTPEDAPTMIFDVKSRMLNAPDRKALELLQPFNPFRMMMRPAPAKK